jgi:hypothetical protein
MQSKKNKRVNKKVVSSLLVLRLYYPRDEIFVGKNRGICRLSMFIQIP